MANKEYKYILLTSLSGKNEMSKMLDEAETTVDIINFYNKYYVKKTCLNHYGKM